MCGRYVAVQKVEFIEKKFNVTAKDNQTKLFLPNFNISIGQKAPIITSDDPHHLQLGQFGFTPSWAKKQMYLFNARSEGDSNKENDPNYSGGLGIITKPAFRNVIRNKRCLVVADCFYEGPEKEGLSKPYLVYVQERKPFAFAGLYDYWINKDTGEEILSYCIITTVANELMRRIGHHRSPVILPASAERKWLNQEASLSSITTYLHPYPANKMNAYPVSPLVKSQKNNSKDLVQPLGQRIYPEHTIKITEEFKIEGMGNRKRN